MIFNRTRIRELISNPDITALEIGPYTSPICDFSKGNVFSCDIDTQEDLISKAKRDPRRSSGVQLGNIPKTHFVLSNKNNYSIHHATDGYIFDYVISSHTLEHSPNLIKSLNDIAKILNPGGRLLAFIPDARFCFDRYRNLSTLPDILDSYYQDRSTNSFRSILDHRIHHTCNDARSWWSSKTDHENKPFKDVTSKVDAEMSQHVSSRLKKLYPTKSTLDALYKQCAAEYVDVHNNTFSSVSFERLARTLISYGYIPDLKLACIQHTIPNTQEFFVSFERI